VAEPDYRRAFAAEDFRGYFTWSKRLSRALDKPLCHACHEDELAMFLEGDTIGLRSEWSFIHPTYGKWTCPGTWCGLNFFLKGNRYGPIVVEIPMSSLHGRTFMVFRRTRGRQRYFFVQYEARIPVFDFEGNLWRRVSPQAYFDQEGGGGAAAPEARSHLRHRLDATGAPKRHDDPQRPPPVVYIPQVLG